MFTCAKCDQVPHDCNEPDSTKLKLNIKCLMEKHNFKRGNRLYIKSGVNFDDRKIPLMQHF